MMESQPETRFREILENIRKHFAFLFRRGFYIASVIFTDQDWKDWQVTMATDDCIIKIYSYMGTVDLALSIPQLYEALGLLELKDLVYGVNESKDFADPVEERTVSEPQSLWRIAQLLEKYLDEILEKIARMTRLLSIDDLSSSSSQPGQMYQYN